jgi:hypothetical protein
MPLRRPKNKYAYWAANGSCRLRLFFGVKKQPMSFVAMASFFYRYKFMFCFLLIGIIIWIFGFSFLVPARS